eukprot:TRINITY_DN2203_c0_g1_i1.p1 TRINITY_DN2203_c0_g1~~TRINITY_DN2203_c0_g1_i1.p1  ORF type:complete len:679 (-),score=186.11 TRINITY_DN2203_c0_g1_i1:69-2105(-)
MAQNAAPAQDKKTVQEMFEAFSKPCPTFDTSFVNAPEKAIKWTLTIDNNLQQHWSPSIILVQVEPKPFAKGNIRAAHKYTDLTHPGQIFVAKFILGPKKVPRDYFFNDVLMQTFCSKWADMYNRRNPPKKIAFLPAYVLEFLDRPAEDGNLVICGAEPFIEGDYQKHNSNYGFVNTSYGHDSNESRNTPQAFSHFTYQHSGKELIVVDIQGVSDFYTDPQIHTKSGKGFGEGNLGPDGIHRFLTKHQCNPLCTFLKLEKINASRRQLLRGTLPAVTLELDSGASSDGSSSGLSDDEIRPQIPGLPSARPQLGSGVPPPKPTAAGKEPPKRPPPRVPEASDSDTSGYESGGSATSSESGSMTESTSAPVPASPAAAPEAAPEAKWDLKSYKNAENIRGKEAECLTGSGTLLISGTPEGNIVLYDTVEKKMKATFSAHRKTIKGLALQENMLFTASLDCMIKQYDVNTLSSSAPATHEAKDPTKSEINTLSVRDNLLFAGCSDKTIKVWDVRSFKCVQTLAAQTVSTLGHTKAVKAVCAMGKYCFSGSNDKQLLVWDLTSGQVVTNLQGHEGWVKTLHGSGSTLVSGSHDETIRVWNWPTLSCVAELKAKDRVEAVYLTPQALFSAAGDYVEVWDPEKKFEKANMLNLRMSVTCLFPHGRDLYCGVTSDQIRLWSCDLAA